MTFGELLYTLRAFDEPSRTVIFARARALVVEHEYDAHRALREALKEIAHDELVRRHGWEAFDA